MGAGWMSVTHRDVHPSYLVSMEGEGASSFFAIPACFTRILSLRELSGGDNRINEHLFIVYQG